MVWGLRILLPTRDQRAAIKLKEELPWGYVTICKGAMLLLSRLGIPGGQWAHHSAV